MDRASVHTGNALEQFPQHNTTLINVHTVPEQLLKQGKNLSGIVSTQPECLHSFDQHNRLLEEVKRGRLHLSSDQFFPRLKSLFIHYCVEIDL